MFDVALTKVIMPYFRKFSMMVMANYYINNYVKKAF